MASVTLSRCDGARAIERDEFPFEHLSQIAELESWRKEINRPSYHIHKWWAQRLGSVFRAIVLGTFAPAGADIMRLFYQPVRLAGAIAFDPFMGSGTTVGEALKCGARAIGRDINPVSHFVVHNALSSHSEQEIVETFRSIEQDVADQIRHFYRARLASGEMVPVLYYFWVKFLPCPACATPVDLFSSYIFAQHAYPKRQPEAQALCPRCGGINSVRYDWRHVRCRNCGGDFDPTSGPAKGTKATCPCCRHEFPIAKTVKQSGRPPSHRPYAKIVLNDDGTKAYVATNEFDIALYAQACDELHTMQDAYPIVRIEPGYNTNQVLNYNYEYWYQMFNSRQLLCLNILASFCLETPFVREE